MTRSVLVPSSLVRDAEDKRAATRKIGTVARAATVFRVDRVTVYPDPEGERIRDGGFVATVLAYAATPPYLRKEEWGERDELEYAGVLPPLRAVTRTGSGPQSSGSLRQGIVTEVGPDGRVRVNCGLQHPISLVTTDEVAEGERVTVRISSRDPVRAKIVDQRTGWSVDRADLPAALGREDAGLRIAASRHGDVVGANDVGSLAGRVEQDDGVTVAFGAPERGLPAILGVDPDEVDTANSPTAGGFDRWLNTVPNQGSDVVRTEEAVLATLAVLNLRA